MKNTLIITADNDDLISSIDDGTNTLFINDVEIPSSDWVGTGNYTTTVEGHSITIAKIASLTGNIMIQKISDFSYKLVSIIKMIPVYQDEEGNVTISGLINGIDLATIGKAVYRGGSPENQVTSLNNQTWTVVGDITLPAGQFLVWIKTRIASNANGRRTLLLTNNNNADASGALSVSAQDHRAPVNGDYTDLACLNFINVDSQTTYYIKVMQNSGSNLGCATRVIAVQLR